MPEHIGRLQIGTPPGVALPPSQEVIIGDISLYHVLRDYIGYKVKLTITVLDELTPETHRVRTIRDLTEPR